MIIIRICLMEIAMLIPFIMNNRINIFINIYTNDKEIRTHSLGFVLSELAEIEAIEYVTNR
jgi:hypothetical protein